MSDSPTRVYTDGSALGNPGPGGWGWWVDADRYDSGTEQGDDPAFTPGATTNNRMELTAIAAALDALGGPLTVVSDSTYARDCLTRWVQGWRKRGWKTAAGKPVKNRDIIEPLATLVAEREVTFEWVKGHSGDPGNEAADRLAHAAATRARG